MILVTGAAGLGGSIVIFEFAGNGVPMLGPGSQSREATAIANPRNVQAVEGDMARAETLSSALEDANSSVSSRRGLLNLRDATPRLFAERLIGKETLFANPLGVLNRLWRERLQRT
jgi:uncharacterized protein YbjT (DUF2867 family)